MIHGQRFFLLKRIFYLKLKSKKTKINCLNIAGAIIDLSLNRAEVNDRLIIKDD